MTGFAWIVSVSIAVASVALIKWHRRQQRRVELMARKVGEPQYGRLRLIKPGDRNEAA